MLYINLPISILYFLHIFWSIIFPKSGSYYLTWEVPLHGDNTKNLTYVEIVGKTLEIGKIRKYEHYSETLTYIENLQRRGFPLLESKMSNKWQIHWKCAQDPYLKSGDTFIWRLCRNVGQWDDLFLLS